MVKKKTYRKPQINQVELVPEEAVLAGCKSAADPSTKVAGSNNCGNSAICSAAGS